MLVLGAFPHPVGVDTGSGGESGDVPDCRPEAAVPVSELQHSCELPDVVKGRVSPGDARVASVTAATVLLHKPQRPHDGRVQGSHHAPNRVPVVVESSPNSRSCARAASSRWRERPFARPESPW